VARAHSHALGEDFDAAVLEAALADQPQRPGNRVGRSEPGRGSGRGLGPAAETRAKTRFRRGGGAREVADVLLLRRRRGADRPAVDAAAENSDEELAVESRVAREPRSRTDLPVEIRQLHAGSVVDLKTGLAALLRSEVRKRPCDRGRRPRTSSFPPRMSLCWPRVRQTRNRWPGIEPGSSGSGRHGGFKWRNALERFWYLRR